MSVPRGFWLGFAALVVAIGLLLAPVAAAPTTRVLGNFQSEAATHAPALAAALEGLTKNGPFLLADHPLYPDRVNGAMFEPITTLVMWPVYTAMGGGARGFTLAWNVWHLVVLVGTALGAWVWARAWLGEERDPGGWGAGLAMALASASLFLHLSPEVGRTEAQNYPLYALHGGLLFRAVRRGGRAWVPAALSVVPVLWAGGYAAVFFAVTEPLVALWALSIAADRRRTLYGLLGVALTAGAAVAPLAWALQKNPYVGLNLRGGDESGLSVGFAVLVGISENFLRELAGYEVAPFAGYATLLAAGLAVARFRGALWPFGVALALYLVAAGPAPTLGGAASWGPAALLASLPGPVAVVRVWPRIIAFAVPIFAVGGAALVAGLPRGRAVLATAFAAAALGEVARVREGSSWSLEPPAELVALREAGHRPIVLPMDGIARTLRWIAPPERPDVWKVMPDHDLFKYFQDTLPNEPELFRGAPSDATYDTCVLLADAARVRGLGFTHVYMREEYLPRDGKGMAARALKALFGVPKEANVWVLPESVDPSCAGADGVATTLTVGKERRGADAGPRTPEEREKIRAERRAERDRVKAERIRRRQAGENTPATPE